MPLPSLAGAAPIEEACSEKGMRRGYISPLISAFARMGAGGKGSIFEKPVVLSLSQLASLAIYVPGLEATIVYRYLTVILNCKNASSFMGCC